MPFTPFHLGIALLIGIIFYKYLDMISILIGSVILDIWPFLVLILGLPYTFHGFSHSFLIAILASLILAIARFSFNKFINLKRSFSIIFFSFLIGTFSHVLLDAPLYSDMVPFWPLVFNPFYGLYNYSSAVWFSIVCFLVAFILILIKLFNRKHY